MNHRTYTYSQAQSNLTKQGDGKNPINVGPSQHESYQLALGMPSLSTKGKLGQLFKKMQDAVHVGLMMNQIFIMTKEDNVKFKFRTEKEIIEWIDNDKQQYIYDLKFKKNEKEEKEAKTYILESCSKLRKSKLVNGSDSFEFKPNSWYNMMQFEWALSHTNKVFNNNKTPLHNFAISEIRGLIENTTTDKQLKTMKHIFKNIHHINSHKNFNLFEGACFKLHPDVEHWYTLSDGKKFDLTIYPARNQKWEDLKDKQLVSLKSDYSKKEFILIGTQAEKNQHDKFNACMELNPEEFIKPMNKEESKSTFTNIKKKLQALDEIKDGIKGDGKNDIKIIKGVFSILNGNPKLLGQMKILQKCYKAIASQAEETAIEMKNAFKPYFGFNFQYSAGGGVLVGGSGYLGLSIVFGLDAKDYKSIDEVVKALESTDIETELVNLDDKFVIVAYLDGKVDGGLNVGYKSEWAFNTITGSNVNAISEEKKMYLTGEVTLGKFVKAEVNLDLNGLDVVYSVDYKEILDPTAWSLNWKITSLGASFRKLLFDQRAVKQRYRYKQNRLKQKQNK